MLKVLVCCPSAGGVGEQRSGGGQTSTSTSAHYSAGV